MSEKFIKTDKSYTLKKIEDNLKSSPENITEDSDVGSNPFPFSEEDHKTKEQFHFGAIDNNTPL